ncbi:MAG: diaminopropionate ammonia-lyase [Rhodobacteraceae bacterium HLUCCA08]|nr:MAG: diaminopropionate ammonia-lyase [Rhodobacteraceae bacterium HLUCCA08]
MVDWVRNPHRGQGLPGPGPLPLDDPEGVRALLDLCPADAETPLRDLPALARELGIAALMLKDERARMGLGSFKALGAAHAIAREAAEVVHKGKADWANALEGRTYITASAGNHGLSVAAGARLFGARAVVVLAETVPDAFAARLQAKGARVLRRGATYESSMDAAEQEAAAQGWTLLSDSSWPGYTEQPTRVMEGYLQMAAEITGQAGRPPSHILLQAGVGGLAAAVAAHARRAWGDAPVVVVVEPAAAPALIDSIRAGALVTADGPVSSMGRLDCKTPSMIALAGLARDADLFVTVSEDEAARAVTRLAAHGIATTPSGAAGLAALFAGLPDLPPEARVLAIVSEAPEDG